MPPSALRSVRSTRLDRETRSLMERGFGEDFRCVTLSLLEGGGSPRAAALDEQVILPADWYRPETTRGRLILAHELAHVVQKRRRGVVRAATASALEAEAHAAAAVVCSGGRFACALADRSPQPRYWGEAGHYYTAYFVLLGAGVDNTTAAKMAFYAQMADEVIELDAIEAGKSFGANTLMAGLYTDPIQAALDPLHTREAQIQALRIQKGLHCLTGRPAAKETEIRTKQLREASLGSFEFGLGLHPFGDSFAHRRLSEPQMYSAPVGHAVEFASGFWEALKEGDFRGAIGRGSKRAHEPDHMDVRPTLYAQYGVDLFRIVREKVTAAPRVNEDGKDLKDYVLKEDGEDLKDYLLKVAKEVTEAGQIKKLRDSARKIGQEMDSYAPEDADLYPWEKFWPQYKQMGINSATLRRAFELARQWSS